MSYKHLTLQEGYLINAYKHTKTQSLIKKYLLMEYSPEQIVATLKIKHNQTISYVTIYKYIYINRLAEGDLYTQLRHKGKRHVKYASKRKSRIKERVSIHKRPKINSFHNSSCGTSQGVRR